MSNFVSSLVRSNNNITELQYSIDTGGTAYSVFKTFKESISPKEVVTKVYIKRVSNLQFVLGNSIYGILGTSVLGDGSTQTLIWGNATYGIWGTAKWSVDNLQVELERVIPPNDIFTERFISEGMIETLTNCNTTDNILTFTGTGLISSELIYYNKINITQAKMDIVINTNENIRLYLSNDDGSTWEEVTNGTIHTFTSTGQKLKYKITADIGTIIDKIIVTKL